MLIPSVDVNIPGKSLPYIWSTDEVTPSFVVVFTNLKTESVVASDMFITKYAITAASPAAPFSVFANPIAIAIANINGRFANTIPPASLTTVRKLLRTVPGPNTASKW